MAGRQLSVKPKSLSSVFLFVSIILFGLLLSHLIHVHVHSSFWWLGLILVLTVVATLRVDIVDPAKKWRLLGKERILLNLEAQHLLKTLGKRGYGESAHSMKSSLDLAQTPVTLVPPLALRSLPFLVFLGLIFVPGLLFEFQTWSKRIMVALEPARLSVEIEPPSYSSTPPTEAHIRKGDALSLRVTAGSYLKLKKTGGRGMQALFDDVARREPSQTTASQRPSSDKVLLLRVAEEKAAEGNTAKTTYQTPFSNDLSWSGSTGLLSEALKLDPSKTAQLRLDILLEGSANKELHKDPDFQIALQIDPTPVPNVNLELAKTNEASGRNAVQEALSSDETEQNQLKFAVNAESQIPLTQVELLVRTESGYKFNMPVGEFAGTDRLSFSSDDVKLQTVGIPFAENDTLYVKARAQTVVQELSGFSQELSFKVKSPQQTRKALIAQLEKILEKLQTPLQNSTEKFQEFKSNLESMLADSVKTAQELGKQSTPARNLESARRLASDLANQNTSQKQLDKIESKVNDTLETLKRRQAQDQASSWFLKTKSYLDKLGRAETISPDLVTEAQSLQAESAKLKAGISQLIDSKNSGLKLEEKQLGMQLLEKDRTPERMQELKEQLEQGKKETAVGKGQATLADATQGLGAVLQLINVARARQIKEAREKLSKADENLENTRQSAQMKEKEQSANQAQKDIDSTPQLGDSFNKALSEAKDGAAKVRQALKQSTSEDQSPALVQELDRTQQAIAEALAALQDEEQASREERGEDEGRRFRSALDALNAQGQLDSGWRKKIFEEISRLREKGVPADADIIRYLESRLR